MQKLWGKIRKGNQRGRELGFPTANILLHKVIPEGIYISEIRVENKLYPAVTFIGTAKTFNENKYQAETFILNFTKQIYDEWATVTLLKKIRDNKRFNSAQELINQMKLDIKAAEKYFN